MFATKVEYQSDVDFQVDLFRFQRRILMLVGSFMESMKLVHLSEFPEVSPGASELEMGAYINEFLGLFRQNMPGRSLTLARFDA